MFSVLNYHNAENSPGIEQLNVIFTGNKGRFKNGFTIVLQVLLCVRTIHRSTSWNAFKCVGTFYGNLPQVTKSLPR
jgi:hypothetical protein